jgi:3-deoxy-D-manno-octulosonic acid kinase
MSHQEKSINNQYYIYDSELISEFSAACFDAEAHRRNRTCVGEAVGRGTTLIVLIDKKRCALRHYFRGGAMAAILKDRYFWRGLNQTRAWQEYKLLDEMVTKGLPVSKPVAARVIKQGRFYRADLITQMIDHSQSLAVILRKKALSDDVWQDMGKTIRRFHQQGIYHSDLNAHNILLDDQSKVYLIDFDKGYIRPQEKAWQQENLDRLKRSLDKLAGMHQEFFVTEDNWWKLLESYSNTA